MDSSVQYQAGRADCARVVENLSPGYKDYRDQIEDAFRRDCVTEMKHHFGIEV